MICSFTGHRPNKLPYGYASNNPFIIWLKSELTKTLSELKPEMAISGMALGVDQIAVEVCIGLGIDFVAAVPFAGQENAWPQPSREHFHSLLKKAAKIHVVSEGGYAAHKMQVRNQFMVDNSDVLIAVYNGDKAGGTANCVNYAEKTGRRIIRIDPNGFVPPNK